MRFIPGVIHAGLIAFLLVAAFVGGRHDGFSSAAAQCRAASLQATIRVEQVAYASLQAQVSKQTAAIAANESAKKKVEDLLAAARARVETVPVAKDCSLGPETIDALNSVRKAGAP